jgi:orotate phosphoribosyltransferase
MTISTVDRLDLMKYLAACYCPVVVQNPDGQTRDGYFNVKKLCGNPIAFRRVVEIIGPQIPGDILASPDHGSAPLVSAVAFHLNLPSIYIRTSPKNYYLSLGSDHTENHPLLFGNRLPSSMNVTLIDDVISWGISLKSAVRLLQEVGLQVRNFFGLINVRSHDSALDELRELGVENSQVLFRGTELVEAWKDGQYEPSSWRSK